MPPILANPYLVPLQSGIVAVINWRFAYVENPLDVEVRYKAIDWESVPDRYDLTKPELAIPQVGLVTEIGFYQKSYIGSALRIDGNSLTTLLEAKEVVERQISAAALYDIYD